MAKGSFAESGADLELVGIRREFPGFVAIEDLNLTIPAGEFFALLGPSGCGKTTTLRLVAGLDSPTKGRIKIGGLDVTEMKAYRRPVNTVFQSYALFPHLSIIENVAFGLRRRGIADPLGKAHEALQLVELDHVAERRPQQLSGGQQQRVALARAVVNRPALLLLDEPLGALDLKLRRQMQIELKKIQGEVGLTFVHVTHDQEEAMTMADNVAVMNKGRIEQMGPPEELYELPQTAFVADFLGQSNLFRGRVSEENPTSFSVDVAGNKITVPKNRAVHSQGDVTVGVRPEKMVLHADPQKKTTSTNVLNGGLVTDVAFTGVSSQYIIAFEGVGDVIVFEQNDEGAPVLWEGSQVSVSWPVERSFGLADHRTTNVAVDADNED